MTTKPTVSGRAGKRKRRFIDAPSVTRCRAVIHLRDKSTADCGRSQMPGSDFCKQHTNQRKASR